MSPQSVPDSLIRAVAHDRKAVRPLHPAWRRTLIVTSVLAVVLAFSLATASLRADIDQLPMWLSWGCSSLQLLLGILLISLALREAVPGLGVPAGTVRTVAVVALVTQVLVGVATSIFSPAVDMLGAGVTAGIGCLRHESLMALPTFAMTLWLVLRALPLRAPTAGMLGGAGAAVASDAILHLLCPMSDLRHVLLWHTGGVVCFLALGWVIGSVWERLRWHRAS
jgi:hypothetical protein